MVYIHNVITAQEIAAYVNEVGTRTQELVGSRLFPARKQLGLKLTHVKGANGQPVVLRASAFDTKATFRDRMEVELMDEAMPFFKEAMLVKEADRQQYRYCYRLRHCCRPVHLDLRLHCRRRYQGPHLPSGLR